MAISFNGMNSDGNKIEYSWTGGTTDDIVGTTTPVTSDLESKMFIPTFNGSVTIVEINFNLVGTGSTSLFFTGKKNHSASGSLDQQFYSKDTNAKGGLYQRWNDNAGILIPEGSHADFTYTNTDELVWGLSVIARTE